MIRTASDVTPVVLHMMEQTCSDTHDEHVLMAGSLGVSSLVCQLNNAEGNTETSHHLLGPFWRMDNGGSIIGSDSPGQPMFVAVWFVDQTGASVKEAKVDVRHSSPVGLYDNQDADRSDFNLRGTFTTDDQGRFWFRSVRPAGYPIPTDTMMGRLPAAQNRHPFRPAHVYVLTFRPGCKTLITQIFADDNPHLDTVIQFGVTAALTGRFTEHFTPHPNQPDIGHWFSLDHTLSMQLGKARLPKPTIN